MQGDDLSDQVTGRIQVFQLFQVAGAQVDPDNDIGPHLPGHIDWEVIVQAAIDQHHTIQSYRRKHSRYGHTGTHRQRKAAFIKHIVFPVHGIYRYTGKRNIKILEVHGVMISDRQVREKVLQVLSPDHTTDHTVFLILAERKGYDISLGVLFLREG